MPTVGLRHLQQLLNMNNVNALVNPDLQVPINMVPLPLLMLHDDIILGQCTHMLHDDHYLISSCRQ